MNEESKKLERPLYLDMPFGEALARFAQTKPAEVEQLTPKTAKGAKPKPDAPKAD